MKAVVVVMALLIGVAAVAGYWWYSAQSTGKDPAPAPAFAYEQNGAYSYVAHLSNNSLYTVDNLSDPMITLFSAITTSLDLSFAYHLTVDRPVQIVTNADLTFALATSAWSKPLGELTGATEVERATGANLAMTYVINVSAVVALASAIQNETGYQPDSFALVITPEVSSTVRTSTSEVALGFSPSLSLNFTNQRIVPSRLVTTELGQYAEPVTSHAVRSFWQVTAWPMALLAVAGIGAGAAGYWAMRTASGPRPQDLEAEVRPYAEAIARTGSLPPPGPRVKVSAWDDLVKVADTIGRPILRVDPGSSSGPALTGSLFYVLADSTTYVYEAPPHGRAEVEESMRTGRLPRFPRGPERIGRFRPTARSYALRSYVPAAARASRRVAALEEGSAGQREAEALLQRSIGLARRGRFSRAWALVQRVETLADKTVDESRNAPGTAAGQVPPDT